MKTISTTGIFLLALSVLAGCKKVSYKKTKSGLAYKLYPGKSTDSLIKTGDVVKFQYSIKFNDSLMENFNSYGKLPGYLKLRPMDNGPTYDFQEVFPQMRKGDSLVTVQMADSLLTKQSPVLPPHAKKGDRLTTTIKVLEVFRLDSLAQADYTIELEKDRPRQEKEQQEMMAKMKKEREEQVKKEDEELTKSGEIAKEIEAMQKYLAGKKINAQKTGKGTFVEIQQQGNGPQAAPQKYVLVKYTGYFLDKDSAFQSNAYPLQLGQGEVIRGWDEGLLLFKEGGKGRLFIPGFLAYGKNPPQGSPFKPFEPLKFDVEILKVSDTPINPPAQQPANQ